ncbi:MAG: hypothetical protein VYE50_02980 [Candidatus Thermoplasmatota archaeon]|nr:hypothetical protein [Candidatus Thermoplasmatota archaeon]MEC9333112.1 hypothetical protein [Candidatus Thermoplasmatota archaeon]MED6306000.1 hypothetical protein [Candidatus Thermoplasmatota archaeon]MEE3242437.1 hypothetical protein [Candidatus Thermoplasmatota archaeon]
MDIERDYLPLLILGIICSLCATAVTIGGVEKTGIWMDAMYPIFMLLAVACFSISWIRWKNR